MSTGVLARLNFPSVSPPITLLFDGACPFCTASARTVERVFGARRVVLRDFQGEGALAPYPSLSHEALMQKMHVVMPDGRVFAGAEAFARIALRAPPLGWIACLYYVPGIRQLADVVYSFVAKHRYRLFGRTASCDGKSCDLHATPRS